MNISRDSVDDFLPLPTNTFHILLSLTDRSRHGYAILQEIAERTGGEVEIGAGALYRSIHRMLEQGLLRETEERPVAELDDQRRRYYELTALGLRVAEAETCRLARMVDSARARGLATGET